MQSDVTRELLEDKRGALQHMLRGDLRREARRAVEAVLAKTEAQLRAFDRDAAALDRR
jgi:hypothetical protein